MIHSGAAASAVTCVRHSLLSGSFQPGRQKCRSRWIARSANALASLRVKVVLPAPPHPTTRMRRPLGARVSSIARRLQPREVLARMVRGPRERACRDHEEALGIGDRLVSLELLGGHETHHLVM